MRPVATLLAAGALRVAPCAAQPPVRQRLHAARSAPARAQPRDALLRAFEASRPTAERGHTSFYFAIGSQNHDPRGAMLDGEASVVVSGPAAALGLVDSYLLLARSTWITTRAELDQEIPPADGWVRRLGRYIRFLL